MINSNYKQNRVSVIIPTYNYGHFIKDCIQSALNQNHRDIEIIVVDDGSTDDTKRIVKPYTDRIAYIYQENLGLSSARNTGLNNSSGEYILFLDSDDMLHPDSIKHRINFLKSNPDKKIAVCRNKLFNKTYDKLFPKNFGSWYLQRKSLGVHLFYHNIAPPNAFLCHREVVANVGYFDTGLKACEDYDYWLKAMFIGYLPYYCDKGVVYYRQHESSMSSNKVNQYYHDGLMVLRLKDLMDKIDYPNNINSSEANLAFACNLLKALYTLKIIRNDTYIDPNNNTELDDMINNLEEIAEPVFINLLDAVRNENYTAGFNTFLYFMKLTNFANFMKLYGAVNADRIYRYYVELRELIKNDVSKKDILSLLIRGELSAIELLILTYENMKKYSTGRKLINLYCGNKGISDKYFPVHYN